MFAFLYTSYQAAQFTFGIGVRMEAFNDIHSRIADLPNDFRDETFLPANARKRKFASDLILDPVSIEMKVSDY